VGERMVARLAAMLAGRGVELDDDIASEEF
jgi:hypothetical protein